MKRILFFHQNTFSNINASVFAGLQREFPHAEIRGVDIDRLLKARPWTIARNLTSTFLEYGQDLLWRHRTLDDAFFSTRYIFQCVRQLTQAIHKQWPADCSFQTQSIFDCSRPGTPNFVYTDHTYESCKEYPVYGKTNWAPIRHEWLIDMERQIYQNATCIFTMSNNITQTLIEKYGIDEERVLCVRGGCNASSERLTHLLLSLDRYRAKMILFLGRRWELKGGPELLEAFRLVREVHSDAMLTIVGCKPRVWEKNVRVVGTVDIDQVAEYYARASIFCLPSKIEAFGIVFLEAMAAGLPVIALKLGAAPDFVIDRETGMLVEPGDIKRLAEALIGLLDDPEKCRTYGENGRALVRKDYTWERVFDKIGSRIAEILGSR